MAATYTSDKLRELFQSTFDLSEWYSFLQNVFNATELRTTAERIKPTKPLPKGVAFKPVNLIIK